MASVDKSVDIAAPVQAVYDQLIRFTEFPRFMEGVEEVRELDDHHLHWRSRCSAGVREWDSVITETVPGKRIAWHNLNDHRNDGYIDLRSTAQDSTHVDMHMEFDPPGPPEEAESAVVHVAERTERDLHSLRDLLQARGS